MDFVGNDAWFTVLLVLHVAGAVIGLGPTFTFAILGPLAGKSGPQGGLAILEGMHKIERGLVLPILLTVQLLTGIGLIFNRGLNEGFFDSRNTWLTTSLGFYAAAILLAIFKATPAIAKMIELGKAGKGGTPEFVKYAGVNQKVGPILTLLSVAIIVLMVWKPGSGCGDLLRC